MTHRILATVTLALLTAGCELHSVVFVSDPSPAAPAALTSITADGAVYLSWEESAAVPPDHYRIYRGESYELLNLLAATGECGYVDFAVYNGVTYFYGVSSVSTAGAESPLSRVVGDTPRPEGYDLVLFDAGTRPDRSAFDFSGPVRVPLDDPSCDVFVECRPYGGALFLSAAGPGTDLQDMGYTESLDDISWSPADGWNPEGLEMLIQGHTYVVWTNDNHFAKLRAVEVAATWARLDWAYQVDPGNPELVKPAHDSAYGRRPTALQPLTSVSAGADAASTELDQSLTTGLRGARQ